MNYLNGLIVVWGENKSPKLNYILGSYIIFQIAREARCLIENSNKYFFCWESGRDINTATLHLWIEFYYQFILHFPLSLSLPNSSMAISESQSRSSLIPNFLYSSSAIPFEKMLCSNVPCGSPSPVVEAASSSTSMKAFSIPSPSEPRKKLEMYSPAFYAACAVGGSLSCGLTHMAVTPLDLVKCNMQVRTAFL